MSAVHQTSRVKNIPYQPFTAYLPKQETNRVFFKTGLPASKIFIFLLQYLLCIKRQNLDFNYYLLEHIRKSVGLHAAKYLVCQKKLDMAWLLP